MKGGDEKVRRRRERDKTGTRRRGVAKNKEWIVGESVSGAQVGVG